MEEKVYHTPTETPSLYLIQGGKNFWPMGLRPFSHHHLVSTEQDTTAG
ncbi:uncharacterized protein G2W53_029416 [Senna tora]|uniref:Uncharacterized protein n=1 Tax=Senna tora TaxID=362788 RepID=A0A834T7K8_9FABA|nr:uncharacterized protein G2W53_029416 [Senna tora]